MAAGGDELLSKRAFVGWNGKGFADAASGELPGGERVGDLWVVDLDVFFRGHCWFLSGSLLVGVQLNAKGCERVRRLVEWLAACGSTNSVYLGALSDCATVDGFQESESVRCAEG